MLELQLRACAALITLVSASACCAPWRWAGWDPLTIPAWHPRGHASPNLRLAPCSRVGTKQGLTHSSSPFLPTQEFPPWIPWSPSLSPLQGRGCCARSHLPWATATQSPAEEHSQHSWIMEQPSPGVSDQGTTEKLPNPPGKNSTKQLHS